MSPMMRISAHLVDRSVNLVAPAGVSSFRGKTSSPILPPWPNAGWLSARARTCAPCKCTPTKDEDKASPQNISSVAMDLGINVLAAVYGEVIKPGSDVLDLCGSWDSHLPSMSLGKVVGHGLNGEDLAANQRLSDWFVQDLNRRVRLPYATASFHAVLCCAGIQYLCQPEAVASEVLRLLRPGGGWIVSFSSHCFEEKALVGWLQRTPSQRIELIVELMFAAGFHSTSVRISPGDEPMQDPFYCVVGHKAPASKMPRVTPEEMSDRFVTPALKEIDLWAGDKPTSPSGVSPSLRAASPKADGVNGANSDLVVQPSISVPRDVTQDTLERWAAAYDAMVRDAMRIGIPGYAIPKLVRSEGGELSLEGIRKARDELQGIMASFFSADI
eukprot:gene31574-6768_t